MLGVRKREFGLIKMGI